MAVEVVDEVARYVAASKNDQAPLGHFARLSTLDLKVGDSCLGFAAANGPRAPPQDGR